MKRLRQQAQSRNRFAAAIVASLLLWSPAYAGWEHVADFDDVRHENGFVEAGNKFYLLGGRESRVVKIYDPTTNTWSDGAAAPIQLHHFQAVALDGLIYVVGAMTGPFPDEPPVDHVYIYDPAADIWMQGAAIPSSRQRGAGGAAAYQGKIYWVSGNTLGHQGPVTANVDVFDPATGTFTALADIPNPRDHFFIVIDNDKIYAIGGRNSNAAVDGDTADDTIAAVDVYDIATNTWTTLPASADLPTPRAAAPTGIIGDEIILAGGETGTAALDVTEAFDLATHDWRTLPDMLSPRHATQAIVSNNGFYIAGGSPKKGGPQGASPDLEVLFLCNATNGHAQPDIDAEPKELIFSAVKGGASEIKPVILSNLGNTDLTITSLALGGGNAADFTIVTDPTPATLGSGECISVDAKFTPSSTSVGSLAAMLEVNSNDPDEAPFEVGLYGLSAEGLQGDNEPPLHNVVTTLGYAIDVGGTDLVLGTGSEPIGDEVEEDLFEKARASVSIEAVARYSNPEVVPFGWYEPNGASPVLHEVGRLSGSSNPPEHQTLFPDLAAGGATFDPVDNVFGLYATSSSHTAYTEDSLNDSAPVQHSVRVYPLKDRDGDPVPNTYLLAFEEASNGDYQDFVFVLRNVGPASEVPGCVFDDNFAVVANEFISNIRNIEACIGIALGPDLHIADNAIVEARAGQHVAIQNGFSVAQGAAFAVKIDTQAGGSAP